jgi:hypothetical protein
MVSSLVCISSLPIVFLLLSLISLLAPCPLGNFRKEKTAKQFAEFEGDAALLTLPLCSLSFVNVSLVPSRIGLQLVITQTVT